MEISFWISATVFYVVSIALCKCNSVNVGTVLFTTTDIVKKCWTECDKSLLKARLIMQDVLPDPECIDFSNPRVVMILLEYFHACFQIISTSTYGKIQNLMFIALSDAIGGYLRAYVLPFTRKAYYAGQVKYSEAKKLFQLYDDIKLFLKTNGVGWAKPQEITFKKLYVSAIPITGGAIEACRQLFTIEKPGKLHSFNTYFDSDFPKCVHFKKNLEKVAPERNLESPAKNSKRFSNFNSTFEQNWKYPTKAKRFLKKIRKLNMINETNNLRSNQKFYRNLMRKISREKTQKPVQQETDIIEVRKSRCDCTCPKCAPKISSYKTIIVPLPVLDDCESPHSIAVPFRKRPFRNLKSRSSAFILEYYYVAVIKCFIAKGNTRSDIKNFNSKFHAWLMSEVYPHLYEEQWYPGFGGVLRVLETIKRFGLDFSVGDQSVQNIGFLFETGVEFEAVGNERKDIARNVDDIEKECLYTKRHVLTAIIIVSLIWIFMFCVCAFYCQATRGRELLYEDCSQEESLIRQPCRNTRPTNDKNVNFQFLVQFFKKKNEPKCTEDTENQCFDYHVQKPAVSETKCYHINYLTTKKNSPRTRKKHTISCRDGNLPTEEIPKWRRPKPVINAWPCQPCFISYDKSDAFNFDQQSKRVSKKVQNQVQTLWEKPLKKLSASFEEGHEKRTSKKRRKSTVSETTSEETLEESSFKTYNATTEDETKSIEKPSSSSCGSKNCYHTSSTITNTSSETEIDDRLSSATMEFFEQVISGHKSLKKCSTTQESMEESNSEEEGSSSK